MNEDNKGYKYEEDAKDAFVAARYEEAIDLYEKAACIYNVNNDIIHEGIATLMVARCYYLLGDMVKAYDNYDDAANIFGRTDAKQQEATSYFEMGCLDYMQDRYSESYDNIYRASVMFDELGDNEAVARTFLVIGNIIYKRGNREEALSYYEDAIKQFGDSCAGGKDVMAAICQCNAARCYVMDGRVSEANVLLINAKSIYTKVKDEESAEKIAHQLDVLDASSAAPYEEVFAGDEDIYAPMLDLAYHEDVEETENSEALDVATGEGATWNSGYKRGVDARAAANRCVVDSRTKDSNFLAYSIDAASCKEQGDYEQAIKYYDKALKIIESEDMLYSIKANMLFCLGECYYAIKDFDEAIDEFKKALEQYEKASNNIAIAKCADMLARVLIVKQDFDKAIKMVTYGMTKIKDVDSPELGIKALLMRELGALNCVKGRVDKGIECYNTAKNYFTELGLLAEIAAIDKLIMDAKNGNNEESAEDTTPTDGANQDASSNISEILAMAFRTQEAGDIDSAIKFYSDAIEEIKKDDSVYVGVLGECYNNLGNCYYDTNVYDKAEKCFIESIRIFKKINEKESVAATFMNLGNNYMKDNKIEGSIKCYKQAFKIYAIDIKTNSVEFAKCCLNLGILTKSIGDDNAVKLLNMAKNLFEELGGHEDEINHINEMLA